MNDDPGGSPNRLPASTHELRFRSLCNPGRGLVVPCDPAGVVDIDSLSHRARVMYFTARALTGREYAFPTIEATPRP